MAIREPYDAYYYPGDFPEEVRMVYFFDPIGATPLGKRYYLAKRFLFTEGDYDIIFEGNDAATLWLGRDAGTQQLILAAQETPEVHVYKKTIRVRDGEYRIDVIAENGLTEPAQAYFALSISQGEKLIYASSKDGWVMDDVPISDDDVPHVEDPRWYLPVLSTTPNWKAGVLERLSWMTDVMSSESAAEQRRSVRRHARRSFELELLRKNEQRTRLDNFFVGLGMRPFLFPLWHEQTVAIDGITKDSPRIVFQNADLALREFHEGDMVFVNNGDPNDYEILMCGPVDNDSIDWAFPPRRNWPPGTRFYPMRTGRLIDVASMEQHTDRVGVAKVRIEQQEPYEVTPSFGPPQVGKPLFRLRPDRATPVVMEYHRQAFMLDNASGPVQVTDAGEYSAVGVQAAFTVFGRSAAFSLRQFLAAARGRAVHFYSPSFTNDFYPVSDIMQGDTQILAHPTGYWEYMDRPQPVRLRLAFYMDNDQTITYADIIAVEPIYKKDAQGVPLFPAQIQYEMFTVANPLPYIRHEQVKRISFISETRFDQDDFELFHVTAGSRAITTNLTFRQMRNPREVTTE